MRSRVLALATVAVVLAACGGGGDDDEAREPSPAADRCPSSGARASGPTTGRVTDVVNELACLDGTPVGGGEDIAARAFVSTDELGLVVISLVQKFERCRAFNSASVQVAPATGRALDLRHGTLACSTDPDADYEVTVHAGSADLDVLDPVFSVAVEGERARVAVLYGFVRVRSATSTGGSVLVGPGLQAFVSPRGDPTVEELALDQLPPRERTSLETLGQEFPATAQGPPNPRGSESLTRILEKGLIVAVDERSLDSESRSFVAAILARLERAWQTRARVRESDPGAAAQLLARGVVDAVVSTVPIQNALLLPLFGDARDRTWVLAASARDERVAEALRTFVVGELESGRYASLYEEEFGRAPPYAPVEALLGP